MMKCTLPHVVQCHLDRNSQGHTTECRQSQAGSCHKYEGRLFHRSDIPDLQYTWLQEGKGSKRVSIQMPLSYILSSTDAVDN